MADYSKFEWHLFSDIEIIKMTHESRKLGDKEFVNACLREMGRRQKSGEVAKHGNPI